MKKMIAFVFVILFAAVFILSYMFGIPESKYSGAVNLTGQIGLGASLLVFFLVPGRNSSPSANNKQQRESN